MPEIAAVGERILALCTRPTRSRSVPSAFVRRLIGILVWCSDGWRLALGALILAAARRASGVERAGVVTIALLLLAYLTFAHPPMWTAYSSEVLPIFYFLAARELGRVVHKAARSRERGGAAANAMLMVAVLLLAARRERRPPGPLRSRRAERLQSLGRSRAGGPARRGKRSYSSAIPRLRIRTWR